MAVNENHADRDLAIRILGCFGVGLAGIPDQQEAADIVNLVVRHLTK